jgi:DnaJ-class molecular chaperone
MAWRWAAETFTRKGEYEDAVIKVTRPAYVIQPCEGCHGTGYIDGDECPECGGDGKGARGGRLGYCGLAGRPEIDW